MAIQIPHDVAVFLNFLGVPYPDINEDRVRELGKHVRSFADNVQETHASMSGTITQMGSIWSGDSYQQLLAEWARLSTTHMRELDTAGRAVAVALDAAAQAIQVVKIAVLAELGALAAEYAATLPEVFVTGGLAAVIEPAIRATVRKLCEAMKQTLLAHLLAEVLGKAIEPFEHAVERLVQRIADSTVAGSPPNGSPAQSLSIDPHAVRQYTDLLHSYADDIRDHVRDFSEAVAGLDLTSPTGNARQISTPPDAGSGPPPSRARAGDHAQLHTAADLRDGSIAGPRVHTPSGAREFPHPFVAGLRREYPADGPTTTNQLSHRSGDSTHVDEPDPVENAAPGRAPAARVSPWSLHESAVSPHPVGTSGAAATVPEAEHSLAIRQTDDTTRQGADDGIQRRRAGLPAHTGEPASSPVTDADIAPGTGPRYRSVEPIRPQQSHPLREDAPAFPAPWRPGRTEQRRATPKKKSSEATRPRRTSDVRPKTAPTPWSTPQPVPSAPPHTVPHHADPTTPQPENRRPASTAIGETNRTAPSMKDG